MRCPMCGVGLAEIKYKDINICKECSKTLNSEVENIPVMHNEVVIGFVKSKVGNMIECTLWDKFVEVETIMVSVVRL